MQKILTLLVILLIAGLSIGQTKPYQGGEAACLITAGNFAGTGTLIAKKGNQALVLGCWHVSPQSRQINCTFQSGKFVAKVVILDQTNDLMVAVIDDFTLGIEPIPIAEQDSPSYNKLESFQFPGADLNQVYKVGSGQIRNGRLFTSFGTHRGGSGSSVISDGKVVGVVSKSNFVSSTDCCPPSKINWLLKNYIEPKYDWVFT